VVSSVSRIQTKTERKYKLRRKSGPLGAMASFAFAGIFWMGLTKIRWFKGGGCFLGSVNKRGRGGWGEFLFDEPGALICKGLEGRDRDGEGGRTGETGAGAGPSGRRVAMDWLVREIC